jgi:hypothetical protein
MYTHVSKYKNDKIKFKKRKRNYANFAFWNAILSCLPVCSIKVMFQITFPRESPCSIHRELKWQEVNLGAFQVHVPKGLWLLVVTCNPNHYFSSVGPLFKRKNSFSL